MEQAAEEENVEYFFGSGQAVLKTTVRGISSRTHHHLNGKEFGNNSTLYY